MQYNEGKAFDELKKLLIASRIPCEIGDITISYPCATQAIFSFIFREDLQAIAINTDVRESETDSCYLEVTHTISEMCAM